MKKLAVVFTIIFMLAAPCLGEDVQKTITVKNDNAELSDITDIVGNQAIIRIYSALTADDAALWNDLMILKDRGIIDITFFINSPGGLAFTGFSLAGIISWAQNNGFKLKAYASGIVASAAVPVFLAFDNREALGNVIFMIHEASTEMAGSTSQFKATNEMLELIRDQYFQILMDRTNIKDRDQWEKWERDTKWIGLDEAREIGIVPEVK
jgi:ATP-dependent protease ClpP protease subunit